jgi:hypothetical protein
MSRAWYQLALAPVPEGAPPSTTGGAPGAGGAAAHPPLGLVAAQGDHLGEAVTAVAKVYPRRAVLAARLCPTAPLGDSVGRSRNVVEQSVADLADLGDPGELGASAFPWPAGVLPELSTLRRLTGAAAGYVVERQPQGVALEVQVEAGELGEAFLTWIEQLPAADNLEVRLLHHFEERATTEVWLTPRIGVKQALRFLDAHDRELIDSGLVELAVYLRKEGSTLRLTEHKTLLWTSLDPSTVERSARTLAGLKVPAVERLVGVAAAPHFHYRPGGTRDRDALARYLHKQRLRLVDRLDRHGV